MSKQSIKRQKQFQFLRDFIKIALYSAFVLWSIYDTFAQPPHNITFTLTMDFVVSPFFFCLF